MMENLLVKELGINDVHLQEGARAVCDWSEKVESAKGNDTKCKQTMTKWENYLQVFRNMWAMTWGMWTVGGTGKCGIKRIEVKLYQFLFGFVEKIELHVGLVFKGERFRFA